MTTKEKLHAVETAIRKALPRLMEPTEGCWLKHKHKSDNHGLYKVCGHNDNYGSGGKNINVLTPTGSIKFIWLEDEEELENFNHVFTILGHDILLSDVFEWLGTLSNFTIDHKGIIYEEFDYYFEGGLDKDYSEVAGVDFSKPYLKDQSKEFWAFLYYFIKDNR